MDSQQGDIYWPVQDGVITWDKVVDIADILTGRAEGRTSDDQIILYKNQGGQGVVDLALAKKLYDLAREHGKGFELDIRPRGELVGSGRPGRLLDVNGILPAICMIPAPTL